MRLPASACAFERTKQSQQMRSVDVTERSSKRRKPFYGYRAYEDVYASVRHGDWKLLAYRSGRLDLFNIVNDKEKQHELSATQPKQVA